MNNDLTRRRLERAIEKLELSAAILSRAVAVYAAANTAADAPRLSLVAPDSNADRHCTGTAP